MSNRKFANNRRRDFARRESGNTAALTRVASGGNSELSMSICLNILVVDLSYQDAIRHKDRYMSTCRPDSKVIFYSLYGMKMYYVFV